MHALQEKEESSVNPKDREKFEQHELGWLQRFSLEGYREEWQPGLRPSVTPRKPKLTAADLILLREMRIRL